MRQLETLRNDWATLRQMLRGIPRGDSHAENLQEFYGAQAHDYDGFRERLLHGRAELIARLPLPANARVVELGGGTGRTVEFFGERLRNIVAFDVVDLCPALLACARGRLRAHPQVRVIEADATTFQPSAPADCVYFCAARIPGPRIWKASASGPIGTGCARCCASPTISPAVCRSAIASIPMPAS